MAKERKRNKIRYNEYYDMQRTLDGLYAKSKRNENFYKLSELIVSEENIQMALRKLSKNSGSRTCGFDKIDISEILSLPTEEVIRKIRDMMNKYQPKVIKRVYIPKSNGKMRPLGIASIWDRLFQQCFLQILEPICEAKFNPQSYGFRSNMSCENAIAAFGMRINISQTLFVVNIDIKGFFDNVDHGKLLKQMWSLGIRDKKVLSIISAMLKAEVAGIGFPERGTQQGGVISPPLANIVLNEFDWWLSNQWATSPIARETKQYGQILRNSRLKKFYAIRYADDVKIMCYDKDTAERIMIASRKWLLERLHLETSDEKTSITDLRKNYSEYLGFMIKAVKRRRTQTGKIKYVVRSKINGKAKIHIYNEARQKLKSLRYAEDEIKRYQIINSYNSFVIGIHNYYQIATMVAKDFSEIGYKIHCLLYVRYRKNLSRPKTRISNKYINKRYGNSRGLLLYNDFPIIPIQYVGFKNPMGSNRKVNQYTEEGRELIHKKFQAVNMEVLHYMMRNPIRDKSFEYNDNRLSLYAAQKGLCVVTKEPLTIGNIHCHHKKPIKLGGNDKYENLILVKVEIHELIHATSPIVIEKIVRELKLERQELLSINKYRRLVGNIEIDI